MLSKTEREKIRARAEKATPGPWYPHATNDATCAGAEYVGLDKGVWPLHDGKMGLATYGDPEQYDADRVIAITCHQRQPAVTASLESDDPNEGNTEFIAHARTDIPALLADIDALEARLAGTEANLKHSEQRENLALIRAEKAEADVKRLASIANADSARISAALAHNGLTEEFGMMGCDVLDQVCDALLGARADLSKLTKITIDAAMKWVAEKSDMDKQIASLQAEISRLRALLPTEHAARGAK